MEHNNNLNDQATILNFCPNLQLTDSKRENLIETDQYVEELTKESPYQDTYYQLRFLERSEDLNGFNEIKRLSKQINYLVNKIKHYREHLDYQ